MFGVVLWSSNEDLSAVIWCEDHQGLAILRRSPNWANRHPMPEAGDLVRFDLEEKNGVREARNTVLVAADHFPGLPGELKSAATSHAATSQEEHVTFDSGMSSAAWGEIVPFPAQLAADQSVDQERRTGTGR